MAELDGTVEETIEDFNGSGYVETEYAFRDFSAKEVAINALMLGLEGGPGGFPDASQVDFTPAGTIAATDVQAALEELDADIQAIEPGEGGGGWPIREFIVCNTPPKAQSNFDNVAADIQSQYVGPFGVVTSDNTNGSWIEWDVALKSGTYALSVKGWGHSGGGILVFSLNDGGGADDIDDAPYSASGNSYDGYDASGDATENPFAVASDITIPDDGIYTLRATVTGKNASSSGHATNLCWMLIQRMGA
jgi:hypothetical protein